MGSLPPAPDLPTPWIPTPLKHSTALSKAASCQVHLKLENLQPGGSFKSRGVGNLLRQTLIEEQEEQLRRQSSSSSSAAAASANADTPSIARPHFYSSSGGNAGLACVTAANTLGCASTVVVPLTTSRFMINNIRLAGASDVIQTGASWAEADRYLREEILGQKVLPQHQPANESSGGIGVESEKNLDTPSAASHGQGAGKGEEEAVGVGRYYVPPFDHPAVWTGNSQLIHELPRRPRAIICSVGGGGLLCGVMQGLAERGWLGHVDVLAVETSGAASLAASLSADTHVTLPKITTVANTLGASRVAARAFEWAREPAHRVTSVVVEDRDAIDGVELAARLERVLVEPACGVCFAVCCRADRLRAVLPDLAPADEVVLVCCGGTNVSVDLIAEWRVQFEDAEAGMRVVRPAGSAR